MEFRNFVEQDLFICTETFISIFNNEPWNDKWTHEKAEKYLSDFYHTPGFVGILAVEDEEVIGFIFGSIRMWWDGSEFFINELGIKRERQNHGIGKTLLNQRIKEVETNDVGNITLLTDRGVPAEEFYKKNGFEEIERLVFYNRNIQI